MLKAQLTRSIAFRFMVYLLVFSTIIALLSTALGLYYDYQENLLLIHKNMNDIKETYSESLAQAIWDLDDEQTKIQINGLLGLPNMAYIAIHTKHGDIAEGTLPEHATSEDFDLVFKRANNPNSTIELGTVHIVASLDSLYDRLRDSIGITFLTEGTKISILAGFVLIIFYFMVTRHLNLMANYAKKLNIGRLDKPLDLSRIFILESTHDELSQVAKSINTMRNTIQVQLDERKISEDAMADQWELLNNVLSNIPSSIYWKNKESVYLGCNYNYAKDAGCDAPQDLIGKTDFDLSWDKNDSSKLEQIEKQIIASGKPALNIEMKQSRPDGNSYTILVSKVPLKNVLGQVIGILGVHTDISEMKIAETQIRELNENLEQKVKDRTQQLEESNVELTNTLSRLQDSQNQLVETEKMAALGNLVSGIANEVSGPIEVGGQSANQLKDNAQKINTLLESKELKKNDFSDFINQSIEITTVILKNLERAAEIIRGFKQVAVDQSSGQKREFTVSDYMDEILISLGPQLKKTKHSISTNCPKGLSIYTNPGALSQIITQLFNNALVHAFEHKEAGHIHIDVTLENDHFILKFSDNGSGIPEEVLPNIFNPFFTTKRDCGGSGLGLHILHNTAQGLGGKVTVKSTVGEGTSFILTIPLSKLVHNESNQ